MIELKCKVLVHMQKTNWCLWRCWQRGWGLGRVNDPAHHLLCSNADYSSLYLSVKFIALERSRWTVIPTGLIRALLSNMNTGSEQNGKLWHVSSSLMSMWGRGGRKASPTLPQQIGQETVASLLAGFRFSHWTRFSKLAVLSAPPSALSYLHREQGKGRDLFLISSWSGERTGQ